LPKVSTTLVLAALAGFTIGAELLTSAICCADSLVFCHRLVDFFMSAGNESNTEALANAARPNKLQDESSSRSPFKVQSGPLALAGCPRCQH